MDKIEYRNQILTKLFSDSELKNKIEGICFRKKIKKGTKFSEDALQETFLALCEMEPEFIIELWEDNPKRLFGLAIRVCIRKCVTKNVNIPDYPGHSLMSRLFHTSNFRQKEFVSPVDEKESPDDFSIIVPAEEEEEDTFTAVWDLILASLNESELVTLTTCLEGKGNAGRHSNEFKINRELLFNRIREIVKESKK